MRARLRSFEFAIGLMVLLEAVFIFLMLWNPVIERAIPRESIQSEGGYLYTVGTSAVPRLWGYRWIGNDANRPRRSTLVLRENGVALGPVHTPADIIRSYGKGLSITGTRSFFSRPATTPTRAPITASTLQAHRRPYSLRYSGC